MDSDSVNKISKASVSLNLNDQTNSGRRKQPKWFITLIIFFILIIVAIVSVLTMIKRDYESELPANNPEKAIKSICSQTPYYQTCFNYMSNALYKDKKLGSTKINSSQVFSISLHTVINELQKVSYSLKSSDSSTDKSTSHCNYPNSYQLFKPCRSSPYSFCRKALKSKLHFNGINQLSKRLWQSQPF